MKNKNKLIILISICVLLIIIGILIINELQKYETVRGTILSTNDDRITIVKEHPEGMPDSSLVYYSMANEDVKTKDIQGKKVNISELKTGDIIEVTFKKDKVNFFDNFLHNVKLIKVIGENHNELENTHYYNSTDNISILIDDITTTGISLTIQDNNVNPYEYSDEYTIYQNKLVKNDTKQNSSTSNISPYIPNESNILVEREKIKNTNKDTSTLSKKINRNTIKKEFDWKNIYGELEQRKILF